MSTSLFVDRLVAGKRGCRGVTQRDAQDATEIDELYVPARQLKVARLQGARDGADRNAAKNDAT